MRALDDGTQVQIDPLLVPRVHRVIDVIDEIPDVVTLQVVPASFRSVRR